MAHEVALVVLAVQGLVAKHVDAVKVRIVVAAGKRFARDYKELGPQLGEIITRRAAS
jgi:hypothetical protein